jgi:hypothetical protein
LIWPRFGSVWPPAEIAARFGSKRTKPRMGSKQAQNKPCQDNQGNSRPWRCLIWPRFGSVWPPAEIGPPRATVSLVVLTGLVLGYKPGIRTTSSCSTSRRHEKAPSLATLTARFGSKRLAPGRDWAATGDCFLGCLDRACSGLVWSPFGVSSHRVIQLVYSV